MATQALKNAFKLHNIRDVRTPDFAAKVDGSAASAGLQSCITDAASNGDMVWVPDGTYTLDAGITQPANVTVELGRAKLDASGISAGTVWTISAGGDATLTREVLRGGSIDGVAVPANGNYNAALDGLNFQTSNIVARGLTVRGCGNAFIFDSNAYVITIRDCVAYYNQQGWNADANGKTNMGAALRADNCVFAHNDYDIYNYLCESTFTNCAFDTPQKGIVKDNITASGGANNGELVWQDCRTEGGGNAAYAYIKNSGLMVLRDHKFFVASAYTYLFDNSGQITIQGGLSRIVGDTYTSRNTGAGTITINGVRTVDLNGQNFRLSAAESQIYNSDAEDTTTGGWVVTTGAAGNFTNINTDAYLGVRCFNAVSGGAAFTVETWAIQIPAGAKKLLLNAYFKNNNATSVFPTLRYYNEAGTQIVSEFQTIAAATTTWTRKRFGDANVVPKGAAYAKLTLTMGLAETSYVRIDDLYVNFW